MKKRLHVPRMQAPLSTVAHGYEYYSKTSPYGMVYLRKKLGTKEEVKETVPSPCECFLKNHPSKCS